MMLSCDHKRYYQNDNKLRWELNMKKNSNCCRHAEGFYWWALGTERSSGHSSNVKIRLLNISLNLIEIIFTRDTRKAKKLLRRMKGGHLPVEHCIEETEAGKFGEKNFMSRCYLFKINRASGYTDWDRIWFRSLKLLDMATDICVVSNLHL